MISVKNVTKRFGKKVVLKGINLEIEENERIAIVGGNGAGKTTLLNILSRNDKKYSGSFKIDADPSEISFQFQTLNYPNEFSLYKLLYMFTVKREGKSIKERLKSELESVGLWEHKNKFPSELSGGQLQKFNLLMTMATNPKIIFFDEILSGLDQPSIASLIDYVKNKIHGQATTITISHSPNEIYELCDRVIVLKDGVISSDYSIDEFESPEELESMMKNSIIDDDEIDYEKLMILDKKYETHGEDAPVIFLEKIKKWYDLHDVLMGENKKGIDAQFYPGQCTAIIGRNGSGKSTLSEIIVGAKKASKGKVTIDIYDTHSKTYHNFNNAIYRYTHDKNVDALIEVMDKIDNQVTTGEMESKKADKLKAKLKKKIDKSHKDKEKDVYKAVKKNSKFNNSPHSTLSAIQFQKQFYPSFLNLRDVVVYNLQLAKVDYDEAYIDYLLECIGLSGSVNSSTHSLSGGQRQKLNILLSIIKKPAVLVLDELTTGLDLLAKEKLLKLIQRYIEEENPLVFVVTHSLEDIEKLANRLIMIDQGKIAYDQPFDSQIESDVQHARELLYSLDAAQ